jgi:hypothetical protein
MAWYKLTVAGGSHIIEDERSVDALAKAYATDGYLTVTPFHFVVGALTAGTQRTLLSPHVISIEETKKP